VAGDDEQGGGGADGVKPKAAWRKGPGKPGSGKPSFGRPGYGKKPGYRPGGRGPAPRRDPRNAPEDGVAVIYGWHPGCEALRNPQRKIRKLLATENAVNRLTAELGTLPVTPELVAPREIDRLLTPDAVHQGIYI